MKLKKFKYFYINYNEWRKERGRRLGNQWIFMKFTIYEIKKERLSERLLSKVINNDDRMIQIQIQIINNK